MEDGRIFSLPIDRLPFIFSLTRALRGYSLLQGRCHLYSIKKVGLDFITSYTYHIMIAVEMHLFLFFPDAQ